MVKSVRTFEDLKKDLDRLVEARRRAMINKLDRDVYLEMEMAFVKNWKNFYILHFKHLSHRELKNKFGVGVALLLFHLDPDSYERIYDK